MSPKKLEFELKNPFDDLFETDESRADRKRERLIDIPISQIDDFPNHPYHVNDDESMFELVESIQTKGVINPVTVRQIEGGRYEMIAGHRRKRACELAGVDIVQARVLDVTRDEAILIMVDSNLQREEILPSEKAFAYKMKLEAMKKIAGRKPIKNGVPVGPNLQTLGKSRDIFADEVGESATQVQRYIRLTNLVPEILQLVDEHKIALRPAVEISHLDEQSQYYLLDAIGFCDATPSHAQTIKMRNFFNEGKLSRDVIESIMGEEKPNQREKPNFSDRRIKDLIPQNLDAVRQTDYVVKALEMYKRYLEKKRNSPDR